MPTKGSFRVAGRGARRAALLALVTAASVLTGCSAGGHDDGAASPDSPAFRPLPRHTGFDYQIGGAYPPPEGVGIVSRDRSDSPAPGLYNICYVNGFQAQPEERASWPADLLLRDARGTVVVDTDWNEALLDLRTPAKRERVAERVNGWTDGCAKKGFAAVELDNYDSYTRSHGLLTADDAVALMRLLTRHAHLRHLAVGQKNTAELTGRRREAGLDFAVAEECGQYDECEVYAKAYADRVVDVEYTAEGLRRAVARWGGRIAVVRRDLDVSTPDEDAYVRETG
ncbi:endo alpha-1,4 polygalactosaminidase [Streptomyces sp. J2-1]|uniref:endo alpha-1,4 polygalactosaminidase n=1 Tax=Streptomyces corallincola TaxID=2851888 RepID=UPI001C383F6A|nr:endo alpha-1,4 polygalactosaminidase [Streptomyces corallincola]MBV2357251.1 endo alpha-1,4 polygalactosaminidase [Streptomyces corallincola]